jgi:hypothetical protein
MGFYSGHAIMMAGGNLVMSLTDVHGFPVEGQGDMEGVGIPSTAQIRWAPDIDLTSPATLFPPPSAESSNSEAMADAEKLGILYILETASCLAEESAESFHFAGWKSWVTTQASEMGQGHNLLQKEASEWKLLSSESRQLLIKAISSKYDDCEEDDDFSIISSCMRHVYENCRKIVASESLTDDTQSYLVNFGLLLQSKLQWADFLSALGHSKPAMRILEIGSGFGAATKVVLDYLKSSEGVRLFSKYIVTGPVDKAVRAAQGDIEYKELRITEDPTEQGFDPNSFDLIIACNVSNEKT